MPDFAVVTAFRATDKISPAFKRMGKNADMFGRKAGGAMARASRGMSALVSKMKMFGGMALAAGAGLIVKEFINFDQAVTSASAKFSDLNRNTKEGQQTLEDLRMTARMVGRDTQFTASQAASGLEFLAMAGFDAKQSMGLLPGVVDLATVANVDLARATDISSDALGAFGMMTTDTAQLTKNFTRINDVMAKTMVSTNTDMENLFEAMKYGGPVFTTAGQSIETFAAITGRMASNAIKGSMAGTALRSGMLRLAAPPRDAADALSKLNIEVAKGGKMRNMIDILGDIETATKGMGEQQKLATLNAIFGKRAFSAYAAILTEGVDKTRALEKTLMGASGASKQMADVMRTSLLNQLKALWSAIVELGFKFIDAFSSQGAGAIKSLTDVARNLGPVFSAAGKMLSLIAKMLPTLIYGFLAYKAAIWGTIIAQKVQLAMGWLKYLFMMRQFITFATVKQWLWNAAMSANPIGLVIIAIAAMVTYLILAIKYWDQWGASITMLFGPFGMLISYIKILYDQWANIKEAFATGGIIAGLKALGMAWLEMLIYPFKQLWGLVQKITGAASGVKGTAPNAAAAKNQGSNVNVNIQNKNVSTTASVTPKKGATIKGDLGTNP